MGNEPQERLARLCLLMTYVVAVSDIRRCYGCSVPNLFLDLFPKSLKTWMSLKPSAIQECSRFHHSHGTWRSDLGTVSSRRRCFLAKQAIRFGTRHFRILANLEIGKSVRECAFDEAEPRDVRSRSKYSELVRSLTSQRGHRLIMIRAIPAGFSQFSILWKTARL